MNEALLNAYSVLPEWKQLLQSLEPGTTTALCELPEGEFDPVVAALHRQTGSPVMLVCANELTAQHHVQDLERVFGLRCAVLPAQEAQFSRAAMSRESTWKRMEVLDALAWNRLDAVCLQVDALLSRTVDPETFRKACLDLGEGSRILPAKLIETLTRVGYENVDMVEGKGQCSMRGAIVDVFPSNAVNALRFEFFDDEVDTIRSFDCISQRSIKRLKNVHIAPATDCLVSDPQTASERLRDALEKDICHLESADNGNDLPAGLSSAEDFFSELDLLEQSEDLLKQSTASANEQIDEKRRRHLQDVETVLSGGTIRTAPVWIHVLCAQTVPVTRYMNNPLIVFHRPDQFGAAVRKAEQNFSDSYREAVQRGDAFSTQERLFYTYDELLADWKNYRCLALTDSVRTFGRTDPHNVISFGSEMAPSYQSRIKELAADIREWRQNTTCVLLLMGGEARARRIITILAEEQIPSSYAESLDNNLITSEVIVMPVGMNHGYLHSSAGICVLTDTDVYGTAYHRAKKSRSSAGERIASFTDLKVGDYIVHDLHGIGIYRGITQLVTEGARRDYLMIDYAGSDKLYVPTDQFDRVNKYIGDEHNLPKLSALGGADWTRQKNKVRSGLKELAFSLAELYARRHQTEGFAFSAETPWQREFNDAFPYELTEDQQRCLAEIEADMESPHNMDRLLCGDVGYGKTEVAMRAAFKALMDGKQVAILAPTTVLVQQHYNTVRKRFAGFPVRFDMLSRFRSAKEQREIAEKLKSGDLDLVIGTHRLLAKDITFHNLGLLIVDEEQRFGVTHKERIQNIKSQVDVLMLSATPIPRTLHMSMTGIRDMSLLETPPEERLPVKTYVMEYNDAVIRDAIRREMSRGGQVFFLYNRVRSMEQMHARLKALVPEARIAIAHGQMRENALEDVMLDFYAGAYDILLCTTIIESGLDVPEANTLIVFDADRFGLAQLYQIRGRVGRSSRQAYAYFTTYPNKMISETAEQRLTAIRQFTEFGSGYRIAMRDLEIRGAGDVLGPQQSGHMESIGYDMYLKLVEEAVSEAKGEEKKPELDTRVDLQVDAYLPEEYVPKEKIRVEIYKRISMIESREDQDNIEDELVDRFGDIPMATMNLMNIARLRATTRKLGISRLYLKPDGVHMRIDTRFMPDGPALLEAMYNTDKRMRLEKTLSGYELILMQKKLFEETALYESDKVMSAVYESYKTIHASHTSAEEAEKHKMSTDG